MASIISLCDMHPPTNTHTPAVIVTKLKRDYSQNYFVDTHTHTHQTGRPNTLLESEQTPVNTLEKGFASNLAHRRVGLIGVGGTHTKSIKLMVSPNLGHVYGAASQGSFIRSACHHFFNGVI